LSENPVTSSVRKTEQIAQEFFHFSTQLKYTLANLTDTHLRRGLFNFFGGGHKTQELKTELNDILCGLIPGFQNVENHTMSDINKIIEDQKRELEAKLALISGNNLAALMTERKGYEAKIAEIDAKIQHVCKELGIEVGLEAPAKKERRTRMSGADIDGKILEVLKNAPQGLSQIAISEATGVSYASVVKWLKENAAKVRTEGERKGKRVFLV
jgi:hypothetical protein